MSTYRDELHVGVYGCLGGLLAGEGPDEAGGVAHGVVALGVGADPVPAATLVHVAVSADQEAGDHKVMLSMEAQRKMFEWGRDSLRYQ